MPDDLSVLREMARWAVSVDSQGIPPLAIATAKRSIVDCIGVTIAAAHEPLSSVIDRFLESSPPGPATAIGRGVGTTSDIAALVNGAQAHALDFDDVSHTMGGHPTIPVLMAALALAEERGATGEQLLRAYCVGVEVETAIGRGVNFTHYDKGWHPTATLGVFGAAAAAAIVLGLNEAQMAVALALATTLSSGLKSSFGTMAKPLQVGRAAQNGILAARLAHAGADGPLDAMEAKQGFAMVYNGEGNFDLDVMTRTLGAPWDLVDPGIAIKLHPCCGGTHAAVDAAIELHREIDDLQRVVSVEAAIHRRRYAHLDRPEPTNPLDAKFSLQHTVAVALRSGIVTVQDFTDEAIVDPSLVRLRSRITASPLPADREGPEHFAAEVEVLLDDGTRLRRRWERPRGRSPETALTDNDIRAKFDSCTDAVLTEPQRDRVWVLIEDLEGSGDLSELPALLRTESPPSDSRGAYGRVSGSSR